MFETHDQARLEPNPLFASEEGAHGWAYISQTSNHEWFYVTYERVVDNETSQQQFMVPIAPYLFGLTARESPEEYIKEIQLVSPPWLNGSDSWLMEKLKSIRMVEQKFCYEICSGRIYPQGLTNSPARVFWEAK